MNVSVTNIYNREATTDRCELHCFALHNDKVLIKGILSFSFLANVGNISASCFATPLPAIHHAASLLSFHRLLILFEFFSLLIL